MTTLIKEWTSDPFDIVWKNFFDVNNSNFNTIQQKINYPVDIYETENGLRFELAVVGLDKEDIQILIESDTLRVTHDKKEEDNKSYLQRGIARRSFDLAWKVAAKYDLAKLEAKLDRGLLILNIPLSEEKAPKKVTIK